MASNDQQKIVSPVPVPPPPHHIRLMTCEDVHEVLNVWKTIGLHEGTRTIHSFMKVDPNGFYVCVSDETGEKYFDC